jgi:MYXO-CTERM domain-containing protein
MRSTLFFGATICSAFVVLAMNCAATRADIVGFNSGVGWQQNGAGYIFGGGGTSIAGNQLTVTTANVSGENSAFYQTRQPTYGFVANFTYTDALNGNGGKNGGNGMAFVIQNDSRGPTVYTYGGGATLGYGTGFNAAIAPSVAIEFNVDKIFYPNAGIAFAVNGTTGTYGPTAQVDLTSGDPIAVTVSYNGSILSTSLRDTTTGAYFSEAESINLSFIGPLAYVGFTGGSGLDTATQLVNNFTYVATPEPSTFLLGLLGALGLFAVARRRHARSPIELG